MSSELENPALLSLPFSLLLSIVEFLSVNEFFYIVQVCKRLNQFKSKEKNHALWQILCEKKWKELHIDDWITNIVTPKWKYLMKEAMMLPDGRDWKWMAICLSIQVGDNIQSNFGFEQSPESSEKKIYIGEFQEGKAHGKGLEILADRYLYYGEWRNGKWHGTGLVLSSNPETGGLYQGELIDSKSHGSGMKIWNNGPRYEGDWQENRMHGEGSYFWDSGEKYEGHWDNGMMSGHGTNYWADGTKHTGLWKNGAAHGRGTRFSKNRLVTDGEWENGHQIQVYSTHNIPLPEDLVSPR